MILFTVFLNTVHALRIDQAAIDMFAHCWRHLHYEHGQEVSVSYSCDDPASTFRGSSRRPECRLRAATCDSVTVSDVVNGTESSKGATGLDTFTFRSEEWDFTMELQHDVAAGNFKLMIKDNVNQGFLLEGTVGTSTFSRRRQLNAQSSLGSMAGWAGFAGFVDMDLFGHRRDCREEKCPERWTDCFSSETHADMLQIQMFVFMDATFCAYFESNSKCEEYTLGVFRDMNLIYESQIGVSIRPAFLLPPDAFEKYWPEAATTRSTDSDQYLGLISKIIGSTPGDNTCVEAVGFERVIGRKTSDFGLFHVIHGRQFTNPQSTSRRSEYLGYGNVEALCNCKAVGWTRYTQDRSGAETWLTLAHEVGHNFGAVHFFSETMEEPGANPNGGLMGYGDATVNGAFAFSDVHKNSICTTIRNAMKSQAGSAAGCFHPYFQHEEQDPRLGESYVVVIGCIIALAGASLFCACLLVMYIWRLRRMQERYDRLRMVHHKEIKRAKGLLADAEMPRSPSQSSENHDYSAVLTDCSGSPKSVNVRHGNASPKIDAPVPSDYPNYDIASCDSPVSPRSTRARNVSAYPRIDAPAPYDSPAYNSATRASPGSPRSAKARNGSASPKFYNAQDEFSSPRSSPRAAANKIKRARIPISVDFPGVAMTPTMPTAPKDTQ